VLSQKPNSKSILFKPQILDSSSLALGLAQDDACRLPAAAAASRLQTGVYFAGGGVEPAAGVIAPGPPGIPAGFATTSAAFIE
jgi:hypothetical protein